MVRRVGEVVAELVVCRGEGSLARGDAGQPTLGEGIGRMSWGGVHPRRWGREGAVPPRSLGLSLHLTTEL